MKILSVVGARPQFIKAAALSRPLRLRHREILLHTGQHYDEQMSGVFFEELGLAQPDINLGVGSGSHGQQTASMLVGIEEVVQSERPDWVLVYGDTNSTSAGALAAAKMSVPIAHVEAGLRSFNRCMPEEINRVLTDQVSSLLLCPSEVAVNNLEREGIRSGVHLVGDLMREALTWAVGAASRRSSILDSLGSDRTSLHPGDSPSRGEYGQSDSAQRNPCGSRSVWDHNDISRASTYAESPRRSWIRSA